MDYLYPWKQFKRKDLPKIIKEIDETFPSSKFSVKRRKNNRGDWGYDETYLVGAICLFKISFDGARRDVKHYYNSALIKLENKKNTTTTESEVSA